MIGMHAATGQQLSAIEHIKQSLADILTTPIGSRVMLREYGSEVPELIDQPLNAETELRIYAATAHAVAIWEPRIELTNISLATDGRGNATLLLEGITEHINVALDIPIKSAGLRDE